MPFLHVEIADELHRRIRVAAATEGKTIKQYVTDALDAATAEKPKRQR